MHDMYGMQLRYNPNIHNAMKMRCLEIRAHGHANRGDGIRNANDMKIAYNHVNGFSAMKCGGKQSRNEAK